MNGFEKYSVMLTDHSYQLYLKDDIFDKPEFKEAFGNQILGLKGPKRLAKKPTQYDEIFLKLFYGFREISDSYYSLIDIETYIGRFPYGNSEISRTRYLGYQMENFLHEAYILKERLRSYLASIVRLYKKDSKHQELLNAKEILLPIIEGVFSRIKDVRGVHVHQRRFSDEDLEQLKTLEFLEKIGDKELSKIRDIFKIVYRTTRKKYKLTIKKNNKKIKDFLDMYFDRLSPIIGNKKGEFRYPDNS